MAPPLFGPLVLLHFSGHEMFLCNMSEISNVLGSAAAGIRPRGSRGQERAEDGWTASDD